MGFTGILGHEFVGVVESVESSNDDEKDINQEWIGKRVCGDINVGCAKIDCHVCNKSLDDRCCQMSRNHCPNRTVLGILKRHGTMAQYITLPLRNLYIVPDHVSDEVAVFAEPLGAACRIVEQNLIGRPSTDKVAILGDGKLGLLIAEVLGRYLKKEKGPKPILFGKHQHKLDLVKDHSGVECRLVSECQDVSSFSGVAEAYASQYDVVVDATGNSAGLNLAAGLCRPMGTLVLKSTCAAGEQFNAAPFVIDELVVVGSRCGPIDRALELLALKKDNDGAAATDDDTPAPLGLEKYITKTFPLSQAQEAIQFASEKSTMKVLIICNEK